MTFTKKKTWGLGFLANSVVGSMWLDLSHGFKPHVGGRDNLKKKINRLWCLFFINSGVSGKRSFINHDVGLMLAFMSWWELFTWLLCFLYNINRNYKTLCFLERLGVVQLVKCLTLDFGSDHDRAVGRSSPTSGCILLMHNLLGILSLCPSSACMHTCSLSK